MPCSLLTGHRRFFDFGVAVHLDFFRLLFVEPGKFGPGIVIDAQQLMACSARVSRRLARCINSVMIQTASVATALKSKCCSVEYEPEGGIQ